ncbi:MAG: DUF4412 domain-containing protein [Candidatus Lernaella stagnicola]|nr:DUF4412 domain-containing protein [Candidatus Lernaella stagnicola]
MLKRALVLSLIVLSVAVAQWAVAQSGTDLSLYREEQVSVSRYPGGMQMQMVTKSWITNQKMRTDAADGADVTIVRADLDKVYSINMKRKVYSEVPIDVYRRTAKLSLAMLSADPTYRWTNRTKTIGKWKCREVIVAEKTGAAGERMQTVWWVSEDSKLDNRLFRRIMAVTVGSEMDAETARFFEKLANIPGYPVQTESSYTREGTTIKSVNKLIKLERREIDESLFELPGGLTKIVVPMPGQLK